MNTIKHALKYLLKAYIGGCVGCLGAATMLTAIAALLAVLFLSSPLPGLVAATVPGLIQAATAGTVPGGYGPQAGQTVAPPPPDCYKTIRAWVSNSEMGSPTSEFSPTDGLFPVVENRTDCGAINAKLLDKNDRVVKERSYSVKAGRNGYGNYNTDRNLAPGPYTVQFWYADNLLQSTQITVR